MSTSSGDTATPPLLLIGMEGLWVTPPLSFHLLYIISLYNVVGHTTLFVGSVSNGLLHIWKRPRQSGEPVQHIASDPQLSLPAGDVPGILPIGPVVQHIGMSGHLPVEFGMACHIGQLPTDLRVGGGPGHLLLHIVVVRRAVDALELDTGAGDGSAALWDCHVTYQYIISIYPCII